MIYDPLNRPEHVVMPFEEPVKQFYSDTVQMSNHDYDLDEITAAAIRALTDWEELQDACEDVIESFSKFHGSLSNDVRNNRDAEILGIAVRNYVASLRAIIDMFDSRASDGTLLYREFIFSPLSTTITFRLSE